MKTERQIAELIFDKFRAANCKTGQIIMFRSIRFGIIDKLNPKEKELFFTVFNGLISTGYFTYEEGNSECIRLTEKGYDYIYDDEKVKAISQLPWVIPPTEKTNWDIAYNRLWRIIGPQETAPHYVDGTTFYKLIYELTDEIPPNYSLYVQQRKDKGLLTSRSAYFKDLINCLSIENRIKLYANIQINIENSINSTDDEDDDIFMLYDWDAHGLKNTQTQPEDIQNDVPKAKEKIELVTQTDESVPTVFISYSWDNEEHQNWVIHLATKLCENGINAILDVWDLGPLGKPLPHFMEKSISQSQRVICIMTPNYKKKTESTTGGVGYEYSIISAEIFVNGANTSKFIPLFRNGTDSDAIPTALIGRKYVDMRQDSQFDAKFVHELLRDIHDEPKFKKPTIGKKPNFE